VHALVSYFDARLCFVLRVYICVRAGRRRPSTVRVCVCVRACMCASVCVCIVCVCVCE